MTRECKDKDEKTGLQLSLSFYYLSQTDMSYLFVCAFVFIFFFISPAINQLTNNVLLIIIVILPVYNLTQVNISESSG